MALINSADIIDKKRDVSEIISMISQDQTPLLKILERKRTTDIITEWLEDINPAGDGTVAALEGADISSYDAGSQPSTKQNICQIYSDTISLSGSAMNNKNAYGRKDELAFQLKKKGVKLRKSLEKTILKNQASRLESGSDARLLGGLPSWITSNVSRGSGGAGTGYSGAVTVAATDGTQRAISETLFKNVLALMADNGANIDSLKAFVGSFNKQTISDQFTGSNTRQIEMGGNNTINASVNFYNHDFGVASVHYSPNQEARDCFLIHPEDFKVRVYRPEELNKHAVTGDNVKYQLITEYTTEVHEKGLGHIADLTTS